jgi:processive 1,2-diacylglycerol beta-glucosyltransferase
MKILIVSVSAGAGHVRAAEAIRQTVVTKFPDTTIEHIDLIDYVSPAMRSMLVDAYEVLASHLPEVWGFLYDKANNTDNVSIGRLTRMINSINGRRFFDYIEHFGPDHIIATHCLPAHAIRSSKREEISHIPLSVVVTDFNLHEWWVVPNTQQYFVATDKMAWQLRQRGIENIIVSGIPIMPAFDMPKDVGELQRKYHCDSDKKTVLILSGGHGLVKIDRILESLAKSSTPLTLISIAGNNERLKRKLQGIVMPSHISSQVVGWTDNIDEYMRIADVVVTKPGGITTSECIALQKPMILVRPIPGQEECNSDHVLESGYGVLARTAADIDYALTLSTRAIAPGYDFLPPTTTPAATMIAKSILQK